MTLYQFNALDETQNPNIIWSGVHLGCRLEGDHNILLYQIDGFYVEVYYHRGFNAIQRFRSFSSVEQLFPHLGRLILMD
jgi:hypothetical protein